MKKGLGRGLGALIPFDDEDEDEIDGIIHSKPKVAEQKVDINNAVQELKINDIEPNAEQPRKYFNEEELAELADSIKKHGVIQPIIVTKNNDKYLIVTGERRWRAARLAGLSTIPAIIKEFAGRELMEVAIIENIQRQDLNPIEEAEALQKLIDCYGLTQEDVAKSLGKNRSTITNKLRLLNLDDKVKEMVITGRLTGSHAKSLATLEKDLQYIVAEEMEKKVLNVRDTEEFVKRMIAKASRVANPVEKKNPLKDIESAISEKLQNTLGTKVQLKASKNRGKIIIDYFSNDELERLLDLLYSVSLMSETDVPTELLNNANGQNGTEKTFNFDH